MEKTYRGMEADGHAALYPSSRAAPSLQRIPVLLQHRQHRPQGLTIALTGL